MPGRGVSSRTVGYEKPRYARTQAFLQLQALWYGKLRRAGFRDIETGRDTNKEKAYAADGQRVSRVLHYSALNDRALSDGDVDIDAQLAINARTFGTYINLADTPTAVAWRNISRAAHDLPRGYTHRSFLIDLAQVGCIAKYLLRRHRLTWRVGNWAFHRFLEDAGLQSYRGILVRGPVVEPS